MKITRDVVYDLLPSYFAGDASQDTRSLIEEFFASDPEFGRMAERFRRLLGQRPSGATDADRAKIVFERTRKSLQLRLAAMAWLFGSMLSLAMAAATPYGGGLSWRHPGVTLGAAFGAMAMLTGGMSLSRKPEMWHAAFTGGKRRDGA
jgi:hypothetical protein